MGEGQAQDLPGVPCASEEHCLGGGEEVTRRVGNTCKALRL